MLCIECCVMLCSTFIRKKCPLIYHRFTALPLTYICIFYLQNPLVFSQCTDALFCLKAGLGQAECAIVNGYNYYSDCISNVRIYIAKVIFCFVINDDDKSYLHRDWFTEVLYNLRGFPISWTHHSLTFDNDIILSVFATFVEVGCFILISRKFCAKENKMRI